MKNTYELGAALLAATCRGDVKSATRYAADLLGSVICGGEPPPSPVAVTTTQIMELAQRLAGPHYGGDC